MAHLFFNSKIKVLSLFFLNRVDDYWQEDGFVRRIFEEEFLIAPNHPLNNLSGLVFELLTKIVLGYGLAVISLKID